MVAAALATLALAPSASAATKEVAVTPTLHVIKGVKNGPPEWSCYDNVVAQWQAWETATAWNLVWTRNGQPGQAFPRPPFSDDEYVNKTPPGGSPPEGYHWHTLNRHSASNFTGNPPPECDVADSVKGSYSSITMYITVDENDPGPDGDAPPPPPPPVGDPPPPINDKLTPTEEPPPPDEWPFDARRSSLTLVDCEPGSKSRDPHLCTAAVWDAHQSDPDASAPTGDVIWFAPTGKLTGSGKRCTLQQVSAVVSTCTTTYKPSSKTHKDNKQPVQGGYQGSKIHRPSSGIDGERPIPVPTDWQAKDRKVSVSLYCGGSQTCKGKATLTAHGGSGGNASSAKRKKWTRELGSSRYKIKPGETKRIKIKLNRKGRKAQRGSKPAKLVLAPSGAKKLSQKLPVRLG